MQHPDRIDGLDNNPPFSRTMIRILPTLALLYLTHAFPLSAQPVKGRPLPAVEIAGPEGGAVAGGAWHSASMSGKVTTLMYVDPDEKDVNAHVEQALKKENFSRDHFASVAVINTAATWKPDSVIRMVLKSKQKEFPDTRYVMDRRKVLVRHWKLADDNYHVLTLDREGRVLYEKAGALNDADIRQLIRLIRENLP